MGEAVDVGEDKGITIQEGKEQDIDDGQVQSQEHDNRFSDGKKEGPVESTEKTMQEFLLANLELRAISIIIHQGTEVSRFPFQESWRVCFRLKENH